MDLSIPSPPAANSPAANSPRGNSPRGSSIATLRARIARIERGAPRPRGPALLLHPSIDAVLPAGGLALGALHEAAGTGPDTEHGAAAALFVAGILARQRGPVLWVVEHADLFAPGLAAAGLRPDRVIYAEAGKPDAVLQAMEEGLRQPGLAGVVGEIGDRLTLTASRRLQLAAETSGTIAFALRRSRKHDDPALGEPSAAVTSWRIAALPSPPPLPHAPIRRAWGGSAGGWSWRAAAGEVEKNPGSWRHAMRRVVSVWLPTLATDRLRRHGAAPSPQAGADGPLITTAHDGRRMVVAAVDATAAVLGLRAGMPLAQAQALAPGLEQGMRPAEPEADAAALEQLAAWCLRYAPLSAADAPDGIWLDVTGCAHLHGGETKLLRDLVGRLAAQGVAARAAVADTPGAAHAVARFGIHREALFVVPVGGTEAALACLPIEALRLPANIANGLRLLGFERVAQLAATPRAPLTRRFGPLVATRLDQALGDVFEPITPVFPPELVQARLAFVEPLLTAESFAAVIARLTGTVCATMEKAGQGARRLDLLFERVDGSIQCLRIGTARPSRDARHLARLLEEKLERVDPGLGVEAMRLVVPLAEPLAYTQASASLSEVERAGQDVSALVDRLENRLGARRVWRAEAVESDVPERSVRRVPALTPPRRTTWPADLPRPVRLLDPPQPVDAMALLPDQPPVAFTWRRVRHRVRRADGPERIAGEWWKRAGEMRSVRDYFRVEDEEGRRFWLFRRGDGEDAATGDLRWFLHGFF